jgi:uncharacterized cupin superfamily protein
MKKSIANLEHVELSSKKTGEKYSLSANISEIFGLRDIFIHHEILPPGRKSSAPHAHSQREELVYVLSGSPTVHLRGKSSPLAPEDYLVPWGNQ